MPEVEYSVLADAKLPYVVHLFCPSPRNENLRAFLPEALNERPDFRGVGFLSCVIDAPYVLLIGNGAVGPLVEDYWVHCTNITIRVIYVNHILSGLVRRSDQYLQYWKEMIGSVREVLPVDAIGRESKPRHHAP